jgi:hypothetical protein
MALELATQGYNIPSIRDEIYVQILKQTSENPKVESTIKGWRVLQLCISSFPPSEGFKDYLWSYIYKHSGLLRLQIFCLTYTTTYQILSRLFLTCDEVSDVSAKDPNAAPARRPSMTGGTKKKDAKPASPKKKKKGGEDDDDDDDEPGGLEEFSVCKHDMVRKIAGEVILLLDHTLTR